MKAMILAAGFGTRMQPLTTNMPKPALTFMGKPLIVHTIEFLKKHGIEDIIINLHYYPHYLENLLGDGDAFGVKLSYSFEKDILGTGGGIKKAKGFLSDDDFVVINSDFLVDFDLSKAISLHKQNQSMATMILRKSKNMHDYGVIDVDKNNNIIKFTSLFGEAEDIFDSGHFTGIHIFSPIIFDYLDKNKEESFCINRFLYPLLFNENKSIKGFFMDGVWDDIGTIAEYYDTHMQYLPSSNFIDESFDLSDIEIIEPVFIGKNCTAEAGTVIGPMAVLEKDISIGKNCTIKESIVFPGSSLPDYNDLDKNIFYMGQTLSPK